ncbi:hypothetical protein AAULR_09025, partial [Lacticaseibacillus rhamnosus MTCC 5462]
LRSLPRRLALTTKKAGAWPAKNMIGFYERLTGAVFFPDR